MKINGQCIHVLIITIKIYKNQLIEIIIKKNSPISFLMLITDQILIKNHIRIFNMIFSKCLILLVLKIYHNQVNTNRLKYNQERIQLKVLFKLQAF